MADRNYGLDERHERAIARLVAGQKASAVAAEIGVSDRTLRKWRTENSAFMSALAAAQNEAFRDGEQRAAGMLDIALDALHEVLTDSTSPAAVRVRAAEVIIARTLDAKRATETSVSADDARLAFREFARANPDEARAIVDGSEKDAAE